jgi:hypothetical protein
MFIVQECITAGNVREVAEKYQINRDTVESWIGNYKKGKLNTRAGRPPVDGETYWREKCLCLEKSINSVTVPRNSNVVSFDDLAENSKSTQYWNALKWVALHD